MSRPLTDAEHAKFSTSLDYYRQLVAALEDLVENGWPTDETLAADPEAVLLDAYSFGSREQPLLKGVAVGHPILETDWTTTSPLVALSPEHRLARTESRWYRLGTPFGKVIVEMGLELAPDDDEKIAPTCEPRR